CALARRRRLPVEAGDRRDAARHDRAAGRPAELRQEKMETVATVVYARLRNVLPAANAMPPQYAAAFVDELRAVLESPIVRQNGVVAQQRADSILAIFANQPDEKPDHARRAVHAAALAVYEAAALNHRIA